MTAGRRLSLGARSAGALFCRVWPLRRRPLFSLRAKGRVWRLPQRRRFSLPARRRRRRVRHELAW